jgi:recombination protein RecA
MFASCATDGRFQDYQLVYDDVERRADFDMGYLFGDALVARLEPPPLDYSDTIQHLKNNVMTLADSGSPFIYVMDSLDALSSDEELEKEMRKALAAAKSKEAADKIAGSYGVEKAKILGQTLRMIKARLADTNSALIITQQTRQRMNAMPFQNPFTTSGGNAPEFYSTIRPWLRQVKTHKAKGAGSTDRKIGVRTQADMQKNSVTGKLRVVEWDIFYDYGIDDVGSMVDFLAKEWWKKTGSYINATELDLKLQRNALVKAVETEGLQKRLRRITAKAWSEIESSLKLDRPRRF